MLKYIILMFLILTILTAGALAAVTSNYAKKAGDPDKYPEKRKESANYALGTAGLCFGGIVLIMILELYLTYINKKTAQMKKK